MTLRDKDQKKICIIGAYKTGASWVTSQNQLVALQESRDGNLAIDTDPTDLWISDLRTFVQKQQANNCNIILTGDFNEDVSVPSTDIVDLATSLGLWEALIERYGKAPNTHDRGSLPIDGIFVSEGIQIIQGGYTSFAVSWSDHRWLWTDISTQELLGESMSDRARPIERKATSKIPSVRDKFNLALNEHLMQYDMHRKVLEFFSTCEKQMKIFHYLHE